MVLRRACEPPASRWSGAGTPRDLPVNALEFAGVRAKNAVEAPIAFCADSRGERRRIAVRIASERQRWRWRTRLRNGASEFEGLSRSGKTAGVRSIAAFAERHGAH